jgi:hypothetical protein
VGVAYLLYMGWTALRERGALRVERGIGALSTARVAVHAVLINLLNPKLSIFVFAFLPQFVHADEAYPLAHMLELRSVFMLLTFVVFVGHGLFAAAIRDRIIAGAHRGALRLDQNGRGLAQDTASRSSAGRMILRSYGRRLQSRSSSEAAGGSDGMSLPGVTKMRTKRVQHRLIVALLSAPPLLFTFAHQRNHR